MGLAMGLGNGAQRPFQLPQLPPLMLTKSAAKTFFLGGTALCGVAFVLLTMDTLAQLPSRSHQEAMTDQVVRGHHIWNKNNCMGCHTLLGEGGYYAPELTKVVERRGAPWIEAFLEDPEGFFPGRRKMVKYAIFDPSKVGAETAAANKADIIAFLDWVGKIDTNGFPAKPTMNQAGPQIPADAQRLEGAPPFFRSVCSGCHAVGGVGGNVGPALDGVSTRLDEVYLRRWIANPQALKPGTAMPKLAMDEATLDSIVTFLRTL